MTCLLNSIYGPRIALGIKNTEVPEADKIAVYYLQSCILKLGLACSGNDIPELNLSIVVKDFSGWKTETTPSPFQYGSLSPVSSLHRRSRDGEKNTSRLEAGSSKREGAEQAETHTRVCTHTHGINPSPGSPISTWVGGERGRNLAPHASGRMRVPILWVEAGTWRGKIIPFAINIAILSRPLWILNFEYDVGEFT